MSWQATGGPGGQQWAVGQARSGVRPQARGPLRDSATGISGRRSASALLDHPIQAGRRTEAGEGTDTASADGNDVVGLVWNECNAKAFR